MILAENRVFYGKVFLSPQALAEANSPEWYAATELRYYFGRMTGANIEIAAQPSEAEPGIYLTRLADGPDTPLGADGFEIHTVENRLVIQGGRRGVIYGAYELLERLGCRFFTPTCEKIPTLPTLEIPELHTTQKPIIEYREHNYADAVQNRKFSVKCRFNGHFHQIPEHMGGNKPYAVFVHSFETLVPTDLYGKTHPEYFSLVDGKRVTTWGGRTQLCLTNPEVLQIAIASARELLKKNPAAKILSISQNDWGGNCQCENCTRIDREEGSPAGTLLRFVNAVAEALEPEFPEVLFDTLAYQYTRPAPAITRNRKNVCVRLCSIECCFAHPFEACDDMTRCVTRPDGTKSRFIDDLRDWGKICDKMFIWDYTTCFSQYPMPYPNWRVLQPNIQTMVKNNVKGIFEQANGASRGGVDFNELRLYLISKLLWDPYCDIAEHRREFMDCYYGAAAPYLDRYLNTLCDIADRENLHVGFNDTLEQEYLREDRLALYNSLFDQAAQAVAGDPLRLYRVEKNRLSVRWCDIKRKTMLKNEFDPAEINRFFEDWRAYNLSRIDEWCNYETTLRALLDRKWRGTEYFEHWGMEAPEIF